MVVSMIGSLTDKSPNALVTLQNDIRENSQATLVIINFRDLVEISGDAVQVFAQLQKEVRARAGGEVRLCGLRPEIRTKLLNKGVIRTSEIYDNLQTAIQLPARMPIKKGA